MHETELLQAAKDGRLDDIRRALAADASLARTRSSSGETPVMAALYRGHHDIVSALVDAGAPLDIFAGAALGRLDVVGAELASHPSSVNVYAYDGWTPLHLAAFFGHTATVERLLGAGADTAAVSANSLTNTPLHAAVAGGHVDAAMLLIARGAPVNVADAGGQHLLIESRQQRAQRPAVDVRLVGQPDDAVEIDRREHARAV